MMLYGLAPYALWIKSFHVISVIAWMAGMLYLPRLFVYHCDAAPGSESSERFKVMELKLYKQIMTPAMLATVGFGTLLVLTPGMVDWHAGWWHMKLLGVILMLGFHGAQGRWRRDFLADRNRRSARFYRVVNEVPAVLMIVIVVMAVAQPF